ncbi:MAG: cytochrome c biogenesis protein CcsA [Acidimicrobiales bacterium]
MGSLGGWLVWVTLAAEATGAVLLWRRRARAGRWCLVLGAAAAAGAVAILGWALVTNDFTLVYVADQSTRAASAPYRLAGLWGGMAGSLLLWVALLAGLAVAGTRLAFRRLPADACVAGAVLGGVTALFAVPLVAVTRPFDHLAVPALDGGGLSPVLEHPAMLYHPPLLYLGYAGLVVPFALAVAGLRSGRVGRAWLDTTRHASLATWGVLTAGIAAGAHWAYLELGWGGFWAWDPVENAALLPWLVVTAFVHLAAVERKRDRVGVLAAALPLLAFAGAVFGAVLTRSGATVSVHAFAEAKAVGWILLGAWALVVATATSAVVAELRRPGRRSALPARGPGPSTVSRLVRVGSGGLLCIAAIVFMGTALPVLEGLVGGSPRVVDAWYFTLLCGPIAAAVVVLLIGAEATGRRGRRRRPSRLAATVGHAGILLVALGVAGSTFGSSRQLALEAGESADVGGLRVRVDGFSSKETERGTQLGAAVSVGRVGPGRTVHVELHRRRGVAAPQSESAVVSTALADVLVVPRRIDVANGLAVIDVHRKPLLMWIWVGAALLVSSAALGLRRRRPTGACAPGAGRASTAPPEPVVAREAAPAPRPPDPEPAPPVGVPAPGR